MDTLHEFQRRGIYERAGHSDVKANATDVIFQLVLDNTVQTRINVIVTASFNIAAALAVILSVVYDAWKLWRKNYIGLQPGRRFDFLRSIHPAEVLPLVLSTAIIMQGIIFIAVQSMGMDTIFVRDCTQIGQIVWPAIWMVAVVLLVFGIEVAYRGLRKDRFGPRGRWNISICWSIAAILILLTWIPSNLHHIKHEDTCIASLIWFAAPFWSFGIIFNSVIIFVLLVTALIISYQLYKTLKVSREERIAASRTVYYLVVGAILMTFVLPFWIIAPVPHFDKVTPTEIASITLNLFGFVVGAVHMLLRSNSDKIAIRSKQAAWGQRREWRIFGSADLNLAQHIERPLTIDGGNGIGRYGIGNEKGPLPGLRSPEHQRLILTDSKPPIPAEPSTIRAPPVGHSRKGSTSYSLFPAREQRNRASSFYGDDLDVLAPPRPLFSRRHRRESSTMSSATVQIGLRLSHAALAATGLSHSAIAQGPSPNENKRPGAPDHGSSSDNSLHLPIQRGSDGLTPTPPERPPVPNPFDDPSSPKNLSFTKSPLIENSNKSPLQNRQSWQRQPQSPLPASQLQRQRSQKDRLFDPLPPIPATSSSLSSTSISPPPRSPLRTQQSPFSPRSPPSTSSPFRSPPRSGPPTSPSVIAGPYLPSSPRPLGANPQRSPLPRTAALPRPIVISKPTIIPSPLRMQPTFPPTSPAPSSPAPDPRPPALPENWPLRNSGLGADRVRSGGESVVGGRLPEEIVLLPSTAYNPNPNRKATAASSPLRREVDGEERRRGDWI